MMRENKLKNLLEDEEIVDLSLSYSKISDFDRNGPISLIRKRDVDNDGIKHGSLVDILLTDKVTNSNNFEKEYVVYDDVKPSATLGKLCDIILDNYLEVPTQNKVLEIIETNKLWTNIKNPEVLDKNYNIPEFWEYLKIKFETKNKKVVTNEEFKKAKENVEILLTHPFTESLFNNKLENYYQFDISFQYKNFIFRGILDKLTIDHKKKIVYMEDIKTGEPKSEKFIESVLKYRYYLQALIYSLAFPHICEKLGLKNYTLAPFKFIYLSKTEKNPIIYNFTEKWLKASLNGFYIGNYKYRGLNELLDEIYFHWKYKEYDLSKKVIESNGILELNDNLLIVNE